MIGDTPVTTRGVRTYNSHATYANVPPADNDASTTKRRGVVQIALLDTAHLKSIRLAVDRQPERGSRSICRRLAPRWSSP